MIPNKHCYTSEYFVSVDATGGSLVDLDGAMTAMASISTTEQALVTRATAGTITGATWGAT